MQRVITKIPVSTVLMTCVFGVFTNLAWNNIQEFTSSCANLWQISSTFLTFSFLVLKEKKVE